MMPHASNPGPRDPRKDACDELARLLVRDGGLREMRLLQLSGFIGDGDSPASDDAEPARLGDRPVPIGIWEPRETAGGLEWVRPEPTRSRGPWSPQEVLRPKTSVLPLRICFLGESTAAGWFYAPEVTPARLLEAQLDRVRGAGLYEVVDLTRIDLQPGELVSVAVAALQLKPDILVVFAGNNWPARCPDYPGATLAQSQEAALAYRESGAGGLVRVTDRTTRSIAGEVLTRFAAVADAAAIPVILVVPEVNRADWERPRPVPWLPGGGVVDWHRLRDRALGHLQAGRHSDAVRTGEAMVRLDGGACALSHRILARARLAMDDDSPARAACVGEVDARAWDNFPSTPGATSTVCDALRTGADEHGFALVDLHDVFAERFGPVPGRRAFLDYCHLTLEGMNVGMAAVAAAVLTLSTPAESADLDWRAIAGAGLPEADPAVDARARLMSALYTGHWNDTIDGRDPSVEYWLESALSAWVGIQSAMLDYLATRSAPVGAVLVSVEQQRVLDSGFGGETRIWSVPSLDAELQTAIRSVLSRAGCPVPAEIDERIYRNHSPERAAIDLLGDTYGWRMVEGQATGAFTARSAFYQAQWPVSRFSVVASGRSDIDLEITARIPEADAPVQFTIEVNGAAVTDCRATGRWQRHRIRIPAALLRPGTNPLSVRWPQPPPDGGAMIRRITARLEQGQPTRLHPVFGEIFRLQAGPSGGSWDGG